MPDATLSEWLLAQIAEDEANQWYLAQEDRPRLLAECEAKRQIVEGLAQDAPTLHDGLRAKLEQHAVEWAWSVAREGVLAALALPYADRPGYDEAWRP